MLVLSRRIGEEIVVAGNIHVTVVAVKGNRVRLGITAPASVRVARLELLAGCSPRMQTQQPSRLGRAEINHVRKREWSRSRS